MTEKTADLHIHSYYSDGTMSPEEILQSAIDNGVGLLTITDHDILEGTLELQKLCEGSGLRYVSGVELNALDHGNNIHILGYGMNLQNLEFCSFVRHNRFLLDKVNSTLIEKMQKDYDNISLQDYEEYHYDRRSGGWKALHYLMDKGLTKSPREGFAFYPQYGCSYDCVDFSSVQTVCENIHRAGGIAILAHPGVSVKEPELAVFTKEVIRLISYGADGIECYYPTHTKEITRVCLEICKERGLCITSGSDCHGNFGTAKIGEPGTPISLIHLGAEKKL